MRTEPPLKSAAGAGSPATSAKSNLWVVEEVAIGDVSPNPAPQRRHGERKITRLMGAIEAFGQGPILVNDALEVLDGHAVLQACRRLGRATLSVIRVSHLGAAEQRALMMARNRLPEDASWDEAVLKLDFQMLLTEPNLGFELEVTGFDQTFVDGVLMAPDAHAEEEVPDLPEAPVTRLGDLWRCGVHRILCGDSRDPDVVASVMAQTSARLVLGDVPYNVAIAGNVSGLGRHKHGEFAMASGEMDRASFVAFQRTVFENVARVCVNGALAYFFIDGRHVRDQIEAAEAVFGSLKQLVVWVKTNAGMGAFYRSQHELVTIWKVGDAPHVNTFELGGSGRYRTNVWTYPGMSSLGRGRDEALSWHPTTKSLALLVDAILDVTHRGDVVLDPFGGSGATMIAAERSGRVARLIEIDPKYVDVTLQRFVKASGELPVLEETGETFEAVASRRAAEATDRGAGSGQDDWDIL